MESALGCSLLDIVRSWTKMYSARLSVWLRVNRRAIMMVSVTMLASSPQHVEPSVRFPAPSQRMGAERYVLAPRSSARPIVS